MKHAFQLEGANVPSRCPIGRGWAGRLATLFSPLRDKDRLIRSESLSQHLLRDVGVIDVVRPSKPQGGGGLRR